MPRTKNSDTGTASSPYKEREAWLSDIASSMHGWFNDLGFPLPPFEIRTGFPSAGRRSPNITESWAQNDTESYVIYVRPDRDDRVEVAAALAHQLCRIAVGQKDSHGHLFRHLAISIGLRGRKTESPPGVLFKELVKPVLDDLGDLPCPEVIPTDKEKKTRQTTRMVKVTCPVCGYVARVSRKWLDSVGPPHCPEHGPMTADE